MTSFPPLWQTRPVRFRSCAFPVRAVTVAPRNWLIVLLELPIKGS